MVVGDDEVERRGGRGTGTGRGAIGDEAAEELGDDERRARTTGSMPAKVSLSVRPMVTAGLAKLVEEVNQ